MGDLDVISMPGYRGMWARRAVVEAWIKAGRPALNWAGRTYEEQLHLALHGPNAADDPRESWTRVPHVRGLALDLVKTDARTVARMEAAGFVRPITTRKDKPWKGGLGQSSQDEPWHHELKKYVNKVFDIPKVTASQTAALDSKPFTPEEDDMTPEQARELNFIYKALAGPNNGDGATTSPISWKNISGGVETAKYGLLSIVIENQRREAVQSGKIAALTSLVQQIQGGSPVDMAVIEQAAEKGAREALAGLTLKADVA